MRSPITGKPMKLMVKEDVIVFKKESFQIFFHHYLDEENGEVYTDEKLDTLNLTQAYNEYRKKYTLPFPDEIRQIRNQYQLSASKMAEILGFGTNVYRHYESGEVPSISNARLIQLIKDPTEFKKLVLTSGAVEGKQLEQLLTIIDSLIEQQSDFSYACLPQYLMTGFDNATPSEYTGYRRPSLKKMIEMIVYFTEQISPWKTKMNKLLFYTDFLHYKKNGYSISGAEYVALQMGPVPHNFGSIFEFAASNGDISVNYTEFPNGGIGESFTPHMKRSFNTEMFTESELEVMKYVGSRFKSASTSDIINISHDELGWIENFNNKNKIKYSYAFSLKHVE